MPRKNKIRTIRVYKSYNFRDKDPVIDQLRTAVADSGASYEDIQADSGVTTQTLKAWFHGGTRRPQFCTVQAVARVIGYDLQMVRASPKVKLLTG
ncbi:MAG: hypothetical protein C5B60_04710 [Chloroflexi bacterium]|nr:MAG: hypothetical protein C5B60_04710 [Chloroflexota bacterium]